MTTSEFKPSWMKWPPNSCEVCTAWKRDGEWNGVCQRAASIHFEQPTDARQRCPEYQRKPDA
ncbi:hypothetical protein ACVIWV_005752 [Bradyrhizobium diazoefficiens]|uniref:hypothetical protein n=1 Tax=Bradyrhizobium diazoefficiens TaxID=1355477 RepID=UPI001B8BBD37|nr:hypothetical protein [Bradyrhizobium diazoefficiens]MBR0867321.1 hypothetical protein [Bradyrhizobium diazoefficiens]MBR0891830.1 hypothetical protein [Bradyrhizobium diazoefficiens]MBR0923595.1 hypothetical protein [Bradyrhizobium diazoefficiens]